jgi:hypothetical protein
VAGCSCIAPTNPCPGVASGVNGPPGRAFQACDRWGHIGATPGPRTTGSQRTTPVNTGPPSAEVTGLTPPPAAGRRDPRRSLTRKRSQLQTLSRPQQASGQPKRWSERCSGAGSAGRVLDGEGSLVGAASRGRLPMESVSLFNLPVHRPLGPDPLIRSFVQHLYAEFARLGPSWSGGASESPLGHGQGGGRRRRAARAASAHHQPLGPAAATGPHCSSAGEEVVTTG